MLQRHEIHHDGHRTFTTRLTMRRQRSQLLRIAELHQDINAPVMVVVPLRDPNFTSTPKTYPNKNSWQPPIRSNTTHTSKVFGESLADLNGHAIQLRFPNSSDAVHLLASKIQFGRFQVMFSLMCVQLVCVLREERGSEHTDMLEKKGANGSQGALANGTQTLLTHLLLSSVVLLQHTLIRIQAHFSIGLFRG